MAEVPLMVMPWHRPDPCKVLKMQTDAAFKSSYLDYLATLRLDSPPLELPLSTITGTIGPASNNTDMLVDLMKQGMTIALVPLALGTRQEQLDTIANIRAANTAFANMRDIVYPLAIAVQTKGPGLRLGGLVKDMPVTLPVHHKVTLTSDKAWRTKGTEHYIYINFPEMCHVLKEGDILLVGSGVVILQVEFVDNTECKCVVAGSGQIQSFMAVSVPDVPLDLPPLTDEDVDDVAVVADLGVDIVVISRCETADLVRDFRQILDNHEGGSGIKLWAQIESERALKNLDCILKVADAVVFSRISLLQDIAPEKLFLAQKIVISTCNKEGVPVYVSSHFLPSMQAAASPTIAEVYDVTAAILDGVDGFVMRNTVSHGKHPDLAVKTLSQCCVEAEAAVWHHQTFSYLNEHAPVPIDPTHSIAIAAVEASLKAGAAAILMITTSGRSAQLVARYRPRCPVVAVTRYGQVARQLNMWRAVVPLHYVDPPLPDWQREVDLRFQFGIEFAKHKGIVKPGDVMILMNGWRQGAGFTNTIRLVYASDSFPWVYPHKLPDTIPSDSDVKEEEDDDDEGESVQEDKPTVTRLGGSENRLVTIMENLSHESSGLSSRIRSLEDHFSATSSKRVKEIDDKLQESVKTMKSDSLRKGRVSMKDREHSSLADVLSLQRSEGKPRTSTETPGQTVLDRKTRQVSQSGSLAKTSLLSKSSVTSGPKPTKTPTKTATVAPKNKTVVGGEGDPENADVMSQVIKEENYEEQE